MGNSSVKETVQAVSDAPVPAAADKTTTDKPKCKACCACPDTKKARDQCIVENGQENCSSLIEAHKQCMRDQGFNI